MSESGDFMILKDLIKSVVFDDVWNELNKEYSMKDRALEAYLRVFNQLKELMPGPNHDDFRLVVARVEDEFEPGTLIFGVLIENGTAEFASWDEVGKDIGYIDDRTEEEKELHYKQLERIITENKRVYETLLS